MNMVNDTVAVEVEVDGVVVVVALDAAAAAAAGVVNVAAIVAIAVAIVGYYDWYNESFHGYLIDFQYKNVIPVTEDVSLVTTLLILLWQMLKMHQHLLHVAELRVLLLIYYFVD